MGTKPSSDGRHWGSHRGCASPLAHPPACPCLPACLQPDTKDSELIAFLDDMMHVTEASVGSGSTVASCYMQTEKHYAFVEFRWGGAVGPGRRGYHSGKGEWPSIPEPRHFCLIVLQRAPSHQGASSLPHVT